LPGFNYFLANYSESFRYCQLGVGRPHRPGGLEDTDVRPGGLTIKVVARI